MNKENVSDLDWLYEQMNKYRGKGMSSDESRIYVGGWCNIVGKMRERVAGDLKEKAEPELEGMDLLRREASGISALNPYTKQECERLLSMMKRFYRDLDKPLPADPKSRDFILRTFRGQVAVFERIIHNIVELHKQSGEGSGSSPAHSRFGGRGDDTPVNTMPFLDPVRIPDKPTTRIPGPRRPR